MSEAHRRFPKVQYQGCDGYGAGGVEPLTRGFTGTEFEIGWDGHRAQLVAVPESGSGVVTGAAHPAELLWQGFDETLENFSPLLWASEEVKDLPHNIE